jgi:hypothetical protein
MLEQLPIDCFNYIIDITGPTSALLAANKALFGLCMARWRPILAQRVNTGGLKWAFLIIKHQIRGPILDMYNKDSTFRLLVDQRCNIEPSIMNRIANGLISPIYALINDTIDGLAPLSAVDILLARYGIVYPFYKKIRDTSVLIGPPDKLVQLISLMVDKSTDYIVDIFRNNKGLYRHTVALFHEKYDKFVPISTNIYNIILSQITGLDEYKWAIANYPIISGYIIGLYLNSGILKFDIGVIYGIIGTRGNNKEDLRRIHDILEDNEKIEAIIAMDRAKVFDATDLMLLRKGHPLNW